MPTEKTLQTKIVKELKSRGFLVYKFSSPAHRGVPDLICIAPGGRVTFLELKHPDGTGRLSRLQQVTIEEMKGKGANVYVCQSLEAALDAVGVRPHT